MDNSTNSGKPLAFNPSGVAAPPPTYSHIAITPVLPKTRLITLAGQVGIDPQTSGVPTDFVKQVELAYANLLNCLRAAGATPRDIIHVRHYIVNGQTGGEADSSEIIDRGWSSLWMEFMDKVGEGYRPPDTVLGVASLAKKELLYEVEAWAIVHDVSKL
ncbi:hypothetical protein H2202_009971 [Exophiala xenobiotica]|nr:hypothetical protein H2202_009971 [Exophiala xenobiotica]